MKTNYELLPEHMREGARLYVEEGIEPGGFMMAVLSNDLKGAFGRADSINTHCMRNWVEWVYMYCPSAAQGSPEKVEAWIEMHEQRRRAAALEKEDRGDLA